MISIIKDYDLCENDIFDHLSDHDHLLYLILESIFIIIPHENLKKNPYAYNKFLMLFDNDDIKKNLKNKIRFKLLDITDYIKNAKSQLS